MKKFTSKRSRRTLTFLFILLLSLIIFRIALPHIVKDYVNKRLRMIDPYEGSIGDIHMALYRGAYVIEDLVIEKKSAEQNEPFIMIPKSDLSIEWKSLFHGKIVGQIEFYSPDLHFVMQENDTTETQLGTETNWVDLVKDLMPIEINRMVAHKATIHFIYKEESLDEETIFEFDSALVTNIRNLENPDSLLPSYFEAEGKCVTAGGIIKIDGNANFLKLVADFDYNLAAESINLKALNPWFKYYASIDFEEGNLDLYSEMLATDGHIKGYFKPIFHDPKIFRWHEKDRTFWEGIKEFFAEALQEILENRRLDTTASVIPIDGNLDAPETDFWPSLFGFIKNAYWHALLGKIEDSIKLIQPNKEEKE